MSENVFPIFPSFSSISSSFYEINSHDIFNENQLTKIFLISRKRRKIIKWSGENWKTCFCGIKYWFFSINSIKTFWSECWRLCGKCAKIAKLLWKCIIIDRAMWKKFFHTENLIENDINFPKFSSAFYQ